MSAKGFERCSLKDSVFFLKSRSEGRITTLKSHEQL